MLGRLEEERDDFWHGIVDIPFFSMEDVVFVLLFILYEIIIFSWNILGL
ncbi:unnamed protein product [Camellia sinensis]